MNNLSMNNLSMNSLPKRIDTPLRSVAEIRTLETALFSLQDSYTVMQTAAQGLFDVISRDVLTNTPADLPAVSQTVHILLGAGNNAGDGLVLGGLLVQANINVIAYTIFDCLFHGDAQKAYQFAIESGLTIRPFSPFHCAEKDIIVEAIFGIGLDRPITGLARSAVEYANHCKSTYPAITVYAVDVPAGIIADTGASVGTALYADTTITFIADKIGLHTADGRASAGRIVVKDLGAATLPEYPCPYPSDCSYSCYSYQHTASPPYLNTHKGNYGHALIVGGGQGMFGAAALASVSALKVGTGKASIYSHPDYVTQYHLEATPIYEVMRCLSLNDVTPYSSVVLGTGLGRGSWGKTTFEQTVNSLANQALLIDADGLWHLAQKAVDKQQLPAVAVITPHEAEAARLLAVSVEAIRADKPQAARQLAQRYRTIAVLKGAGTVISDGQSLWFNTTGNSYLATAGTGDVLAGIIGGYLAQGYPPLDAALYGVYRHGLAADDYRQTHADKSLRAGDLWDFL